MLLRFSLVWMIHAFEKVQQMADGGIIYTHWIASPMSYEATAYWDGLVVNILQRGEAACRGH